MWVLEKKYLKKCCEQQYSSKIYTVESVHGKTIMLTNGLIKAKHAIIST